MAHGAQSRSRAQEITQVERLEDGDATWIRVRRDPVLNSNQFIHAEAHFGLRLLGTIAGGEKAKGLAFMGAPRSIRFRGGANRTNSTRRHPADRRLPRRPHPEVHPSGNRAWSGTRG